jgi:RNA recognition motif-containing protein
VISNGLGVFGLTLYTTEKELKDEFSRFGPLKKVLLIRDGLSECFKEYTVKLGNKELFGHPKIVP